MGQKSGNYLQLARGESNQAMQICLSRHQFNRTEWSRAAAVMDLLQSTAKPWRLSTAAKP